MQYLHTILEPSEPAATSPTSSTSFAPARFSNGHLHALAALLGNKGKHATWPKYFGACVGSRERGAALQAWMYHLLGSEASGLEMPASWKSGTSTKRLLTNSRRDERGGCSEGVRAGRGPAAQAAPCGCGAPSRPRAARLAHGARGRRDRASSRCSALAGSLRPMTSSTHKQPSAPIAAPASVSPEGRVWQLIEELRTERAHLDELCVEFQASQRELRLRRALRREVCAAAVIDAKGEWAELQIKVTAQE